jgi:CubicO group peptidase (beta-lactamase class C family)
MAHRGWGIPNTIDTRFALASGSKTFTALAVVSLIEDGALTLDTTARSVLGSDVPLIDERVTVGHLLAHRSGIGDYLDENAGYDLSDYMMPVPVHELDTTESFLAVLDGFPTAFAPDVTCIADCRGYVVLALIAERASGVPFHDLVQQRSAVRRAWSTPRTSAPTSCRAAPRSATSARCVGPDEHLPPARAGQRRRRRVLDRGRHQLVLVRAVRGRMVSPAWVAEMVRPTARCRPAPPATGWGSGWARPGPRSSSRAATRACRSERARPGHRADHDRLSNTTDGAWPILRYLEESQPA